MRRFVSPFFGLILLALVLVVLQNFAGLSTDEAKFLLNIPYPHPPLLRWLMGLTFWMPGQALFWRVVFATALLQAAWIVMALLPEKKRSEREILGWLWVLSASVLILSGQILMAPVAALQALVFCWLLLRGENLEAHVGWIALLWLASLFTAYQALLFLPIVVSVFWRLRLSAWQRLLCIVGPVALLALYSLTNPLAIASMIAASGQNAHAGTLFDAVREVTGLWMLGGSVVMSVLGVIGMLAARRWPLILSFLLTAVFILVSYRPYYCILFTPLLLAGVASAPLLLKRSRLIIISTILSALILVPLGYRMVVPPFAQQIVDRAIEAGVPKGATMMIAGSFGHEWQYVSPYLVRRFIPEKISDARVLVCLADCPEVREKKAWKRLAGVQVEVWVRPIR